MSGAVTRSRSSLGSIVYAPGPYGPYYFQIVSLTPTGRPRLRELATFQFDVERRVRLAHPVPHRFVSERVITTSVDKRDRVRVPGLGVLWQYRPASSLAAALRVPCL